MDLAEIDVWSLCAKEGEDVGFVRCDRGVGVPLREVAGEAPHEPIVEGWAGGLQVVQVVSELADGGLEGVAGVLCWGDGVEVAEFF